MRRGAPLFLLLALLAQPARAQELPPTLSEGGLCGPVAPCADSGDFAAHLRATVALWDVQSRAISPSGRFGFSGSFWHWAEAGVSWDVALQRIDPGAGMAVRNQLQQGPVTLWARLSPPPLPWLAAQVEYATAHPPFDAAGTLYPDTTTAAAILSLRRGRVVLDGSAGPQLAPGYRGGQAGVAVWLRVSKALGLSIGGEALGRLGSDGPGPGLRSEWSAFAGVSLAGDDGWQMGLGVLAKGGRSGPPHAAALATLAYHMGKAYHPPPGQDPSLLELLAEDLAQLYARRHGELLARQLAQDMPGPGCPLPLKSAPLRLVHACAVAAYHHEEPEGGIVADVRTGLKEAPKVARDFTINALEGGAETMGRLGRGAYHLLSDPRLAAAAQVWQSVHVPMVGGGVRVKMPRPGELERLEAAAARLEGEAVHARPPPARGPPAVDHAGPVTGTRTRGGVGPVRQGQAGVDAVAAQQAQAGGQVIGHEVTFHTPKGTRRSDLLVKDKAGNLTAIEVKTGKSPYTAAQQAKDAELSKGTAIPAGKRAAEAGLSGQPVTIPTKVIRLP